MPNHCENDLTVEGHIALIHDFVDSVRSLEDSERYLDFNRLIPYPERFAALDKAAQEWDDVARSVGRARSSLETRPTDGYNSGGYNWCCDNWGTKWNAYQLKEPIIDDWHDDYTTVKMSFTTAWCPSVPIFVAMAERWPDLDFELVWYERGSGQHGRLTFARQTDEDDESEPKALKEEVAPYFGNRGG